MSTIDRMIQLVRQALFAPITLLGLLSTIILFSGNANAGPLVSHTLAFPTITSLSKALTVPLPNFGLVPLATPPTLGLLACAPPVGTSITKCDDGNGNIKIGEGATRGCEGEVVVDRKTNNYKQITINKGGTLIVPDTQTQLGQVSLTTTGIDVFGTLEIGSSVCPIGTLASSVTAGPRVVVTFTGDRPPSTQCGDLSKGATGNGTCPGYQKGIQVESGGIIRMFGRKGVPGALPNAGVNWTYLAEPAGDPTKFAGSTGVLEPPTSAANVIYTASRTDADEGGAGIAAWKPGDWIAVATTSFSPWETEFVQIQSIGKDPTAGSTGSKITLSQPLAFYHFGGANPGVPSTGNYDAGSSTTQRQNLNFGVDERAEVALISRSILLTSDADSTAGSKHWGGELKFLQGLTEVSMQGVELQKFGKEQLGSYPIHFHLDGDLGAKKILVDSNSVDHSYNKCITVHSTQNVKYTNNVCARITGHIFYEEVGNENNITFDGNVGIGAMSNSFDVNTTAEMSRADLIKKYYWVGDNMFTPPNGTPSNTVFDQINIFDADSQFVSTQGLTSAAISTRGQCAAGFDAQGKVILAGVPDNQIAPTCYPGNTSKPFYFEPPSGFWLLNPSAKLMNNSIAGCQDTGAAYWYESPQDANVNGVQYIPIGPKYVVENPAKYGLFQNNRGHSCYRGLNDEQFELGTGNSITGYENAQYQNPPNNTTNHPVVDEFDGLTLSRIRYRGIWLRPTFYLVDEGRLATNRRGISFVTSGGADGNYPGVWSLMSRSTMVGISTNNVDRFGPCGSKILVAGAQVRGGTFGCIDQTVPQSGPATGGEFTEKGYPVPDENMFGFMSYDGPPLIVKDRFVNYLVDPSQTLWTKADQAVVASWSFINNYTHYEGDAGIGWLDSNQSAYPVAASTKNLNFTNVNFRHQVYTDLVNIAAFNDGDKNTSILDLDGTLSGYEVMDPNGKPAFPVSLNNLPFNFSSNSVDECRAEGQQNVDLEGRPTAAMVPSGIGQLEFESPLFPVNSKNDGTPNKFPNSVPPLNGDLSQLLTFYKTDIDFNQHGAMSLHSRNGLGVWEPKVASGYGYAVRADPYDFPGSGPTGAGIGSLVDVSLVDTVKPTISSTNPFYFQLGICYTDTAGNHPADKFQISTGYRSWGGGSVQSNDIALRSYYNQLNQLIDAKQWCTNLDTQGFNNLGPLGPLPSNADFTGCPSPGIALKGNSACPEGTTQITDRQGQVSCVFPIDTPPLTEAKSLTEMNTVDMTTKLPDLNKYFYDTSTGMLYLWVYQSDPNAVGPSPLGICKGNPQDPEFCPQKTDAGALSTGESYYNCPKEGCTTYRIVLNDSNYIPGVSNCKVFGGDGTANSWLNGTGGNPWQPPTSQPALVYADNIAKKVTRMPNPGQFPHYSDASAPVCAVNQ
ncbi:MAG TPA: G8 domain-containing protein [Candidatus Binataceae bacterium]|nr:G8 domain-containing protein [Candidatus Binataceae bacterium]